jgi:hypothetical protein
MSEANIFTIAATLFAIAIALLFLTLRRAVVQTIRRRRPGKKDNGAFRELSDSEIDFRQEEQSQEQTRLSSEDERRRHEEELRHKDLEREFSQRLERRHEDEEVPEYRELEPVRFHALWQRNSEPGIWQTMLVYIFSGLRGFEGARADFARRTTVPSDLYDDSSAIATERIRYGTQISIHPELPGFRFNPPFSSVLWLEDWHCTEFRMQALPETRSLVGEQVEGRVAFYVGPLLIGETKLLTQITEQVPLIGSETRELWAEAGVYPYRAIFVSYSHQDSYIVDQLERAYRALGDTYLRDVAVLRSGEAWNPALLGKIYEADIFQFCWSEAVETLIEIRRM